MRMMTDLSEKLRIVTMNITRTVIRIMTLRQESAELILKEHAGEHQAAPGEGPFGIRHGIALLLAHMQMDPRRVVQIAPMAPDRDGIEPQHPYVSPALQGQHAAVVAIIGVQIVLPSLSRMNVVGTASTSVSIFSTESV